MSKFTLAHGAGINDAIALYRHGYRRTRTGIVKGSAHFYAGDTGVAVCTKDEKLAREIVQRVRARALGNKVDISNKRGEWWVIFTPTP